MQENFHNLITFDNLCVNFWHKFVESIEEKNKKRMYTKITTKGAFISLTITLKSYQML